MRRFYLSILILAAVSAAIFISYQVGVTYFYIRGLECKNMDEVRPLPGNSGDEVGPLASMKEARPLRRDSGEEAEPQGKVDLNVPFTPQAPYAEWDQLHNEACEEAVVVMAHYFLKRDDLTRQRADEEIISLVNWQVENWGSHHHLAISDVAKLFEYYGYKNIKVAYDITLEDIRDQLLQGSLVIVPTAGRKLGNPYYKRPGPLYHMLVIRGFEKDEVITNDPGTRRGEGFRYQEGVLFQAIHDLPEGGEEEILSGLKAMLIIGP